MHFRGRGEGERGKRGGRVRSGGRAAQLSPLKVALCDLQLLCLGVQQMLKITGGCG